MMTVPYQGIRWRKSSRSTASDTCVELAHTHDAVRDSKNPTGPTLTIDIGGLLSTVKVGRFDR
jgi:hypothetical protein